MFSHHVDVKTCRSLSYYWPFVRGIHQSTSVMQSVYVTVGLNKMLKKQLSCQCWDGMRVIWLNCYVLIHILGTCYRTVFFLSVWCINCYVFCIIWYKYYIQQEICDNLSRFHLQSNCSLSLKKIFQYQFVVINWNYLQQRALSSMTNFFGIMSLAYWGGTKMVPFCWWKFQMFF